MKKFVSRLVAGLLVALSLGACAQFSGPPDFDVSTNRPRNPAHEGPPT